MCVCIQMLHVLMQMVCVVIVGIYDAFKAQLLIILLLSMEKERFGDETLALTLKRWTFSFIYILKWKENIHLLSFREPYAFTFYHKVNKLHHYFIPLIKGRTMLWYCWSLFLNIMLTQCLRSRDDDAIYTRSA